MQQQYYQIPKPPPPPDISKWFVPKPIIPVVAPTPVVQDTPPTVTVEIVTTKDTPIDTHINKPEMQVDANVVDSDLVEITTSPIVPELMNNSDLSYKILSLPILGGDSVLRSINWASKQPIKIAWTSKYEDVIPRDLLGNNNDQLFNIKLAWTCYTIWSQLRPKGQIPKSINVQVEFGLWYEWLLLKRFYPSVTTFLNWLAEREFEPRIIFQINTFDELMSTVSLSGPVISTRGCVISTIDVKKKKLSGYDCVRLLSNNTEQPTTVLEPEQIDEFTSEEIKSCCYIPK
jgi:hypothetical protein